MTWQIIAYFILSIGIVAYGTNALLPSGTGRAILFGIGSTLLFIFFGFRWFSSSSSSSEPKTWPPTINSCPDYLTYVPKNSPTIVSDICVDYLGVSVNGGLGKTNKNDSISYTTNTAFASGAKIFPYTSANIKGSSVQAICDACATAGITWEGIFDGDSCIGAAAARKAAAAAGKDCNA